MYSSATLSPQQLVNLIEAGEQAAEDFRHDEAVEEFSVAVKSSLLKPEQLAKVRCYLAESLEYLARYREALSTMSAYIKPEARAGLSEPTLFQVWLRLGSLQGYVGDQPRAISYLKSALALAEKSQKPVELGACHLVLGRIYRAIGEAQFARDHLRTALTHHRQLGHWAALAQNYLFLGNVYLSEGEMAAARENFEQAIKIIGDHRAPLLLGSIYTSLSNLILLQEYRQATEGVETLEKAIHYLKEAKNDRLLAYAYSNLGFVLTNIGEWERAEQALQYAIEVGSQLDNHAVQGTSLDTLSELHILRGNYQTAEQLLKRSLAHLEEANFPYGKVQAIQTLGRYYLTQGQFESATKAFAQQLALAERIEDKRSRNSAQLYLARTQVEVGQLAAAQELLDKVAEEIDSSANISLVGHLRAVNGLLQLRTENYESARQELGQALTIFQMVADRYRQATAHFHLSQVLAKMGDRERARAEIKQARTGALHFGTTPLLQQIETVSKELESITANDHSAALAQTHSRALSNAIVLRLIRASSSRELLLHELVMLLAEMTDCSPVIAFEEINGAIQTQAVARGSLREAENIRAQQSEKIHLASSDWGSMPGLKAGGRLFYKLRSQTSKLVIAFGLGREHQLRRELIEPLFRLAEMGLDLTDRSNRIEAEAEFDVVQINSQVTADGFVFASPAMRSLLADIHKIRSSRVTVLITGESGTGKEVVANTIHNLSERRQKPFIAFNCTIAAPELVNSQLFGHKKGSFTGAVTDEIGVIQSAEGGTLFLDEIGDLGLDVQPKLLRFLQDGENHRLGETTPTKVDARVVAATNADLEKLVAEGKFREDLYYRLNIIRLHLPPLRARREEIPVLLDHFLKLYTQQSHKEDITISSHTVDLLRVYNWPGNVRQLANEIQRLVAYKDSGEVITERDLSPNIYNLRRETEHSPKNLSTVTETLLQDAPPPLPEKNNVADRTAPYQVDFQPGRKKLSEIVDEVETQVILDAMRRHDGHRTAVCEELGITRKGLYLKLRRLPGIDMSEFE